MPQPSFIDKLSSAARSEGARALRAQKAADVIRRARAYRWVGIYEVERDDLTLVAWSGFGGPPTPRRPVPDGLCGTAVRTGLAIVGGKRPEIVVPILARESVIGVIDVESDDPPPVGDRAVLQDCASVLAALWSDRPEPSRLRSGA